MATNYVRPGEVVQVTWATTSPTAGDPVVKMTSKAAGGLIGVALNGTATASQAIQVATTGVFDLSVTAAAAAIAIGDYIFVADPGNVEVCTAALTNTNTGLIFGQALEAIGNGLTDTINVKLLQPSHA